MILSDSLTRDEAREAFSRELTYADVTAIDVRALQGFIAVECARHDKALEQSGQLLMLMQPANRKKGRTEHHRIEGTCRHLRSIFAY